MTKDQAQSILSDIANERTDCESCGFGPAADYRIVDVTGLDPMWKLNSIIRLCERCADHSPNSLMRMPARKRDNGRDNFDIVLLPETWERIHTDIVYRIDVITRLADALSATRRELADCEANLASILEVS